LGDIDDADMNREMIVEEPETGENRA
jgi:hypothetical protein